MIRRAGKILMIVIALAMLSGKTLARTWTDRQGRTVEAEFIGLEAGMVKIKRDSDGRLFEFPLDKLSDADQKYVNLLGNAGLGRPAEPVKTANGDSLEEELREVVAEMLREKGLSADRIAAEADSRVEEGIAAVRQFYPEFVTGKTPSNPQLTTNRIGLVHEQMPLLVKMLPQHTRRRKLSMVPAVRRWQEKSAAERLEFAPIEQWLFDPPVQGGKSFDMSNVVEEFINKGRQ